MSRTLRFIFTDSATVSNS